MDADNVDTVIPKEPVFGDWIGLVSKSVKKPREPALKMHSQQIEVVNTVIYKEREREKRKSNLLIFGLTNEGEAEDANKVSTKVSGILESIGVEKNSMRKARRFRSSNESSMAPAPVFVQMSSEATRNLVLREARKLRGLSGMDRVNIKPDQTEAERVLEKQLRTRRDELNKNENKQSSLFRLSIFRGQIRK